MRAAVVEWLAARFPKWPAIDAALSREGWKLVTLLRLSPLVPWNVLNYALSVTGAFQTSQHHDVVAPSVANVIYMGILIWARG